jgi:hypothetical protein
LKQTSEQVTQLLAAVTTGRRRKSGSSPTRRGERDVRHDGIVPCSRARARGDAGKLTHAAELSQHVEKFNRTASFSKHLAKQSNLAAKS